MSNAPARLMLKPAQLRLILEIAEAGQLQQAAASCGLSQPAASRLLAETERQLGAALFERHPKGMAPTEIGASVLRRAGVILDEMQGLAGDVRALAGGLAGSVRVGAVTGPAVDYLVAAIRQIKAEAPEAEVTVDVMPSRELLGHLVAGDMDFVLARILPEFDSRELLIQPMRDEKVSFCVRLGHPLDHGRPVGLAQLLDQPWIMQSRGAPIREATLDAFASAGLSEPRNVVNSPSLLFTVSYLAQSDAIAPLSDEVVALLTDPPVSARFARLPLQGQISVPPYYLLSLRRRPPSPLAERLRACVIEKSRQRPGPTDPRPGAVP
ncbi:LysR family transcriptional regulator [Paracoccus liaowanqingii]|uniref:LysR family transcriptional regulator n=1 Tax=Paracoccus liaowanqingii TaxID=2560053 RepID=A0A4Z1CQD4_9RHOB|nr:LysR family transcriptional regulator [Paracoccus liaowanqingii]TGN67175.1 LysR family transcriptional regulator [Paracoccus liaowanqingii]